MIDREIDSEDVALDMNATGIFKVMFAVIGLLVVGGGWVSRNITLAIDENKTAISKLSDNMETAIQRTGEASLIAAEKAMGLANKVDRSIAEITASRFTAQDGLELWKEVYEIRRQIAALPSTNEPPKWLVDRITIIEKKLENN